MLRAEDLDRLSEIVAKCDCFIISDEIYEKLNFSGIVSLSPASRPEMAERTITINGFSKAFSMTGWRIGYMAVPNDEVLKAASRLQQHLNTNTATFVQKAALASFDLPADHLEKYNRRLAENLSALKSVVSRNEKLRLVPSEGGLFAFLDISKFAIPSDEFTTELLAATNVAATPGVVFGGNWDGHIRTSLAIEPSLFAEGVERLGSFAGRLTA